MDVQMLFVSTFGPGVGKLQSVLHYFDRLSESSTLRYCNTHMHIRARSGLTARCLQFRRAR
jgi:hypothetical protein